MKTRSEHPRKLCARDLDVTTLLLSVVFLASACGGGGANPVDVFLGVGGGVGEPALTFSPNPHDFGPVALNASAADRTVTVTNSSAQAVYISSIEETSSHYNLISDNCPRGFPLDILATCTFTVRFTPLASGSQSLSVNFHYGTTPATNAQYTASAGMTGTGISPLVFTGLTSLSNITHRAIRLNWPVTANATSFVIFRMVAGSMVYEKTVVNTAGTVAFDTVSTLTPSTAYTFRVRAIDAFGSPDSNTVDLSATTLANTAPTLAAIAAQTSYQGMSWSVDANESTTGNDLDLDGDSIAYTCYYDTVVDGAVASSTPCTNLLNQDASSATFSSTTGIFAWTPAFSITPGTAYEVKVTGSDGYGGTSSRIFLNTVNAGVPIVAHSVTVGAPCATTALDCIYPSRAIAPGTALSIDFTNTRTGSDTGVDSYACSYDRVVDAGVSTALPCTGLPGTAAFNTATGILTWTPSASSPGPFEIKVSATNVGGTASEYFIVDVTAGITTTNLLGYWDAMFAKPSQHGVNTPVFTSAWANLIPAGVDGALLGFAATVASGWTGTMTTPITSSVDGPFRLNFDGVDDRVGFGTSLNNQSGFFFDTWVRPTNSNSAGKVILSNADAGGLGFTLRQSGYGNGKVELQLGTGTSTEEEILSLAPNGYWPLDDKAGIIAIDHSGNGNHGTISSGPLPGQLGIGENSETAFSFNGSSGTVSIPNTATTGFTSSEMTIALWVYPTDVNALQAMVHKEQNFTLAIWNGGYTFAHSGNWSYSNTGVHGSVTQNTWQHVAVVKTTSGYEFYLNGVSVGTYTGAPAQNPVTPSSSLMHIGSYDGNSMRVNGRLQHVALFSTGLTGTQIQNLYLAGRRPGCRSPALLGAGIWSHISGFFDNAADQMRLFVNGEEACRTNFVTAAYTNSGQPLTLGRSPAGANAWAGGVGEVHAYSSGTGATATANFTATENRYLEYVPTLNLKAWWRADSIRGATNGSPVSFLQDGSTSRNSAYQITPADQPIYTTNAIGTRPALLFDGTKCLQSVTGDSLGDYTVFTVFKTTGVNNYERILDKDYLNGFFLSREGATASSFGGGVRENAPPYGIFGTYPDGSPNILTSIRTGSTHELYANGTAGPSNTVSAAVTSTAKYGIGCWYDGNSTQRFGGYIAEILVYDSALSAAERLRVERYLGTKYGITVP